MTLKLLPLEDAWPDSRNSWISSFEGTIRSSPKLETLHVRSGCANPYTFAARRRDKKFPPVRELCIEGDWQYSAHRVVRMWDFSNISVLKLWYIDLDAFVASVPLEQLSMLKKFEFLSKDRLTNPYPSSPAKSVEHLISIISKIERLEELVVECYHPHQLLPSFKKHKLSFRVLKLRDLNVVGPQATLEDLESLGTLCPYLKELELDIKVAGVPQRQEQ